MLSKFNIKPDIIRNQMRSATGIEQVRLAVLLHVAKLARTKQLLEENRGGDKNLQARLAKRFAVQKSRSPIQQVRAQTALVLGLIDGQQVNKIQEVIHVIRITNNPVVTKVRPNLSHLVQIAEVALAALEQMV